MNKEIIIHCSDSTWGNAAEISRWHTLPKPQGRGWSKIGYHFVILNGRITLDYYDGNFDGVTETGRAMNEHGAHTKGHNGSIGVCLIGKSGQFTSNQLIELKDLIEQIEKLIGFCDIKQHSDYDDKKPFCAGLSKEQLEFLRG